MRGEGSGLERTGRREAGRTIVKGAAAAARGAGRRAQGPGRVGPPRGGQGSGARTVEPAEELGEGGLPEEGGAGGGWEGRKGEGGDGWMGNAEAPREKGAREWS